MMLRWILSLLAVATLAMGSCLANGGGYQRGGVRSTGAIEGSTRETRRTFGSSIKTCSSS